MLPKELREQIVKARECLAASVAGDLPLCERVKIWKLFGEARGDLDKEYPAYLPGHKRRTILQKLCAEKVLPLWERKVDDGGTARDTLKVVDDFLNRGYPYGYQNYTHLQKERMILCVENYTGGDSLGAVGWACVSVVLTAIVDQNDWEDDDWESSADLDYDVYGWHADFCACIAYANGTSDMPESSMERRREFWQWYLDEAVVEAYSQLHPVFT